MENSILNQLENDTLNTYMRFGRWKYVSVNGVPTYFYADKVMDDLLGIYTDVTPEERSQIYQQRIYPADIGIVNEYTVQLQHRPTEVEYRYIHPKLGVRMVRCFGKMMKDADGSMYTVGMHLDITENVHLRYQTEQADHTLAQLTQRLYGFNLTLDLFTGEYRLIEGSGMDEAMGIIRKHVDYKVIVSVLVKTIHPDYKEEYLNKFSFDSIKKKANKLGYIGSMEFPVRYSENERYKWHEITLFMDADEHGEPIANILGRDVTEAHEKADTEAQLAIEREASKSKTNFLFNMSHDIRTPMNAIIGYTELLQKHLDNKELATTYLQKIQTSNAFLLSLINNVLEMARIESGKAVIEENLFDAKMFNNTLFDVFEAQMKQKGITFIRSIDVEHKSVYCDGTKLREVFLNILSNALKYTPSGGTVTMSTIELKGDDPTYALYQTTITDTGIGMSADFLPHLFEEFTRERSSTESRIIGTGLGMAIVKRLVELMNGSIAVRSKVGEGSTFIITIPHRIANEEVVVEAETTSHETDEQLLKGKRILLAEDNELNSEIAITLLQEYGFVVEHAIDGKVCLNMMKESEEGYYDLILMDIQMPNMDGYTATRHIRNLPSERKAAIPIVAMTANAFDEDKRNALEAGMNGHLAKPIEIPVLIATLSDILT